PQNPKEKVQLGMLTPERGMISLTVEGAEIIAGTGKNIVEMTDFEMKGNLFAIGVLSADPGIRPGDEAIVMLNGNVEAVGVAMMSGREMVDLKRGIAVKIRHKKK
ncbi:MAG: queuine tRNA-ribosyltransferase containing PUA domain protein, partial [Candidatus Methanoplasma sp.]|nr:queuine tRNA-ribosyltransferase containing PUA domain protein [Candidatus Methanoplasma sp.]